MRRRKVVRTSRSAAARGEVTSPMRAAWRGSGR
jgi:hypothetical protein